jgi:molybdopterin molybdotransferase
MSLLPVDEAISLVLQRVPTPAPEAVSLNEAAGRVLFEPLFASHSQPPFDASAMDGYAVRAADVAVGQAQRVVGMSRAGKGFDGQLGPREAVRIFTGAPVPMGADTVIMQEQAEVRGTDVLFSVEPRQGHSVRPLGSDFAAGQQLIDTGTLLSPFHLAVAAAANTARLSVAKRPSVALLSTGDELVPPGSLLRPDQIVASNSYALAPLLRPYAEDVVDYGIARDDKDELRSRLTAIFATEPDVLITTGGASVGDHDIVQDLLIEMGVALDFWRINMRPGKPLMFGTFGKTLVFGLPGNPVSALVTALVFVKPALRQWLGFKAKTAWKLPLAAPTPPNTARRHFMRAKLEQTATGPRALPISITDSGHTSSLAAADLLIIQPEFDPGQPEGTIVDIIWIGSF